MDFGYLIGIMVERLIVGFEITVRMPGENTVAHEVRLELVTFSR